MVSCVVSYVWLCRLENRQVCIVSKSEGNSRVLVPSIGSVATFFADDLLYNTPLYPHIHLRYDRKPWFSWFWITVGPSFNDLNCMLLTCPLSPLWGVTDRDSLIIYRIGE